MLKNLKSEISLRLQDNLDLEEIALYIIQFELIHYLQKHNIFALGNIFDNLFKEISKINQLDIFLKTLDLIKAKKNGNRFLIVPNKKPKFVFATFIEVLKEFFEKCKQKEIEMTSFDMGLTYEYFMFSKNKSKTGSFYTPLHLVKVICKKTIVTHLYYAMFGDTYFHNNREQVSLDTLRSISEPKKLTRLHSLITSMKILDPSMGVGNFLLEASEYLLFLYDFFAIDGKENILTILSKQIYGLDINKSSILIAKVRFSLVLLDHGFHLEELSDKDIFPNLLIKDSLTSLPPMQETLPFSLKNDNKFSIILSNPPFGAKLTNQFKKEAKRKFNTVKGIEIFDFYLKKRKITKGNPNSAVLFTEICANLLNEVGFCSIILPKSILYIEAWESLRVYLSEKEYNVISLIDLQKGFDKVLLEQIICVFNKRTLNNMSEVKRNSLDVHIEEFDASNKLTTVAKGTYFNFNKIIINRNEEFRKIFDQIKPWNDFLVKSHRGLVVSKYIEKELSETNTPIIRGRDIQPLYIRSVSYCPKIQIEEKEYFQYGTLMIQRIIAHVNKPKPHIILTVALNPGLPTVDTIVNIYRSDKGPDFSKALAMFLNSEFINWYTYHFIYCDAIRSMDIFGYYLNQVPIQSIDRYQKSLVPYFEILTFLKTLLKVDEKYITNLQSYIEFIERMANAFIYYIYLNKLKFNEFDNKIHIEEININSFIIRISFNFDTWYKNEQFCQMDTWNIDIANLINEITILKNNKDIMKVIQFIEKISIVKSIINEFR